VEDAIARKAEGDGLIGFVDDELIADIEDIPPDVFDISCMPRRDDGEKNEQSKLGHVASPNDLQAEISNRLIQRAWLSCLPTAR
jgi:hypothetical protein